jgi:hypothetical protein
MKHDEMIEEQYGRVACQRRAVEDESVARIPRERKEKANSCEVAHKDLEREVSVRISICNC